MYKILIVDDEERIRTVIKTYALNEGYEVYSIENNTHIIFKSNILSI